MLTYIISALIVLGLLIVVHEYGHFFAARKLGIGVERFSIGFGPSIKSWKRGETEYIIAWVPLGGYVKLYGDNPEEEYEDTQHMGFLQQPVWKRITLAAAGPFANFLLAALFFALVYMIGVPVLKPVIGDIKDGSPAQSAGLAKDDEITAIGDTKITRWDEMAGIVHDSPGKALEFTILHANGETEKKIITPREETVESIFGDKATVGLIGITPAERTFIKRYGPIDGMMRGFEKTWEVTELTVIGIVKMIQGKVAAENIGGPLMIFKTAGDKANEGILNLMLFIAVISVNLAILNLIPIPILDGGLIVFFLIEGIMGRPIDMKYREIAQQIGVAIVASLMLFAFYNDIKRFIAG